ncbi:hypothetical protein [Nonomuraea sp. LPB2021202275-12-8]|uniref:hypothetical protein n=1 Tax=Nonomuraea sp. LPB2021202275-12-8 TaxID=3120159 RepID=UPI00300C949C
MLHPAAGVVRGERGQMRRAHGIVFTTQRIIDKQPPTSCGPGYPKTSASPGRTPTSTGRIAPFRPRIDDGSVVVDLDDLDDHASRRVARAAGTGAFGMRARSTRAKATDSRRATPAPPLSSRATSARATTMPAVPSPGWVWEP